MELAKKNDAESAATNAMNLKLEQLRVVAGIVEGRRMYLPF